MVQKPTFQQRFGFTPGKLVLVGVLGVVFVSVLYFQFFADDGTTVNATLAENPVAKSVTKGSAKPVIEKTNRRSSNPGPANQKKAAPVAKAAARTADPSIKVRTNAARPAAEVDTPTLIAAVTSTHIEAWPEMDIETAANHDPFKIPLGLERMASVEPSSPDAGDADTLANEIAEEQRHRLIEQQLQAEIKKEARIRSEALAKAKAEFDKQVTAEQKRINEAIEKIYADGSTIVLINNKTRVVQIGGSVLEENDTFGDIRVQKINDDSSFVLVPAQAPLVFVPPIELLDESGTNQE